MKAKVEGGELRIDLLALVEALPNKDRNDLARYLVADELLWRAVLECVTDDSKYFGHYFKDDEEGEWSFHHTTVLKLRELLVPLMPEIARLAVEEALRQRNQAQENERRTDAWAWKLYHAWPRDEWRSRPVGPGDWTKGDEDVSDEAAKMLAVSK